MTRSFIFIGVTTAQSSIMQIFPRWRDILQLGAGVEIEGWDLPLHAPPERYREAVQRIAQDETILGGLVTTHKIDLYHATHDLFAAVDRYAELLDEVSCIAKRSDGLRGFAKDPITAGKALDDILGAGYFERTEGEVLCLGAGGAGQAITLNLLSRPKGQRPASLTVTDPNEQRLYAIRALHAQLHHGIRTDYVQTSMPEEHDALVEQLAPASLVVNATGLGKDRPGSPVSDAVHFPERGVIWEINYRGELPFLYQAWNQRNERNLRVADGWDYFIYGWSAHIEEVFQRAISAEEIRKLSEAAAFARPALPTNTVGVAE